MKLVSGNPGLGLGESDARYLRLAGGTLTGALVTKAVSVQIPTPAQIPAGPDADPGLPITQAWNSAGLTWTAALISVTDTASGSGSKLIDAQVGGASKFAVRKTGATFLGSSASSPVLIPSDGMLGVNRRDNSTTLPLFSVGQYSRTSATIVSGGFFGWSSSATDTSGGNHTPDTALARTSAGLVEVNNGTAGTLRDFKCRRATVTEYQEVLVSSEPSAPTSGARLWADLSGGKVFLMARFPTGASQVVAQEP